MKPFRNGIKYNVNGWHSRNYHDVLAVTADGEPDNLRMDEKRLYTFAEAVMIFDEDGNVVYELDPELFQ